ncbi:MAG: PilZ domain-containing protein [Myxococcales bacterium]|nr:PilZ domain-containing protein [Myxococcales bacterium]
MNAVWDRKEPRVAFQTNVRLIPPDESTAVDGQTENLSESGLFVVTEAPLEPRSHVLCQLALPGRRLTVRGRVVWVHRGEDSSLQGAGIEFIELSTLDRQLLRDAVGSHDAIDGEQPVALSREGGADPAQQRSVTVWFEGMAVPVRAQAHMTEHGLRLRTALPFLRRDSSVGFVMSEEQDPRPGVLRCVKLEANSAIPELDIEVVLADEPHVVEPRALRAISSAESPAADGEIAAAEAHLHAELEAALRDEDEGITLAELRGDVPLEPSVEIDLDELEAPYIDSDGFVHARADVDDDGYEDDDGYGDDDGYADDGYEDEDDALEDDADERPEEDELALRDEHPTDPVGAPPSHVLEAARRDDEPSAVLREIIATPEGPVRASVFDSEAAAETLITKNEDKADGFWAEAERRRRRFWLWLAALAMSGIAVASLVKTRFWDNVSGNVGKYFEKPKIVFNPAVVPTVKKAQPSAPKVGSPASAPRQSDVAPPATGNKASSGKGAAPAKLQAGIPLPGDDSADKGGGGAAAPGSEPVVLYERGQVLVRVPVRGTAREMKQYELDQPRGVSINLPKAQAALPMKVYRLKKHGVRKVWVRSRKGGIQVRVFYKHAMRPKVRVEGGVLEIRLARR